MVSGNALKIRAAFFDFDGVLIDTELEMFRLWRAEYARRDCLLTSDSWALTRRNSLPPDRRETVDVALALGARARVDDVDTLRADLRRSYEEARERLPIRPGMREWLSECRRGGIACIIVTDAERRVVECSLERWGLRDAIDAIYSREDGPAKPDPANYLRAVRESGCPRELAVAVEDSVRGIEAARRAGLRVLATPHKATGHTLRAADDVAVVSPERMTFGEAVTCLLGMRGWAAGTVTETSVPERIVGSLRALALGDALGKVLDKRPSRDWDSETRLVAATACQGGLMPPALFNGRVTDDTMQTLVIAASVAKEGRIRGAVIEDRLRRMNPHGGRQIYRLKASSVSPFFARGGCSNGAIPRSSALGWCTRVSDWGDLVYAADRVAAMTHQGAPARAAAMLQAVLVSGAVAGLGVRDLRTVVADFAAQVRLVLPGAMDYWDTWAGEVKRLERVRCDPKSAFERLARSYGVGVHSHASGMVAQVMASASFDPAEARAAMVMYPEGGDLDSILAIHGAIVGALDPEAVLPSWADKALEWALRSADEPRPPTAELVAALVKVRAA